ncbi:hypothetical protein [Cupriavidus sp. IDO]|uniref:hypothetical protein n=1 Tax=Cupriavidus sp. IDO TaxID=1539142 RepID=UPI001269A031|nr:hypothetical protein [Cupriavidus sp. IDO]
MSQRDVLGGLFAAIANGRRRSLLFPASRKEFAGALQTEDIVRALGHIGECEPCVQAGLEVLARARQELVRTVVTLGPGRKASLDFYIEADIESCCLLDSEVQRALAGRTTSVLPPSLSLGVRPLATYVHESRGESEAAVAARFRVSAKELMLLGGEMNQRLSVVCAYLSALYDAQEAADSLGFLNQSLLGDGQETLSWRFRRHRSVEGRTLAQCLEGLSRAADGAMYEFGTGYSYERASYQFEQMRRFHHQLDLFRKACRPGADCWSDLTDRAAYSKTRR